MPHTFQSSEGIKVAIFARLCFINPTRVAEDGGIFLMREIERHKGMKMIYLGRELGVFDRS